jgi:hypothetical protein
MARIVNPLRIVSLLRIVRAVAKAVHPSANVKS